MRIGHGYDVHKFVKGRKLILGGIEIPYEMGLDGLELEFVHGVRISDKSREQVADAVKNSGKIITAHAPFYVNLNAREEDKVEASVQRIIYTAMTANELGGYSITYHAAFYMGADKEMGGTLASISLIFLSCLFTGLGLFPKLAKKAGAGTAVPITGFANAVSSAAIEFKNEGFIFGVGAKLFTVAGPVIVYGIVSSVAGGILYYFFAM